MIGTNNVRGFITRNADLFLSAVLVVAAVYFFSGKFTTVHFDQERIEVRVDGSEIRVRGIYHYTNVSWLPAVLTLKIPFPIDADHPSPTEWVVYETGPQGQIQTELPLALKGDDGFVRLIFRPSEGKWIRLDYTQPSRVTAGRYLLTTTRAWRRPIGRADFALHLPVRFELVSSSFPVKRVAATAHENSFAFSRTDFYPDRDWDFTWRDPQQETACSEVRQP